MTVADAIAEFGVESLPYTFGGTAPIGTREVLFTVLSDTAGLCPFFETNPVSGSQPASTSYLTLIVVGADATTPIGTGTYPILNVALTGDAGAAVPSGPFAIASFTNMNGSCGQTPPSAGNAGIATSGSVVITGETLAGVSGTFTANFSGTDAFQGSFAAPACTGGPDGGAGDDAGTICPPGGNGEAGAGDSGGGFSCASLANIDLTACNPVLQSGCGANQACAINASQQATCVTLTAPDASAGQGTTCTQQSACAAGTQCVNPPGGLCETYCCTSADCSSFGNGFSCKQITTGTNGAYGVCQQG
jgi:hypothetical protein